MTHVTIEPSILYVGTPVALLSTMNDDDTINLAPMSSAWALGDVVVVDVVVAVVVVLPAARECGTVERC